MAQQPIAANTLALQAKTMATTCERCSRQLPSPGADCPMCALGSLLASGMPQDHTPPLVREVPGYGRLYIDPAYPDRIYPSVTNVLSMLDKPHLRDWYAKQATLAILGADPDLTPEELYRLGTSAPHAVRDAKASLGTDFHVAVQAIVEGKDPGDLSERTKEQIKAWDVWRNRCANLKFLETEVSIFHRGQRWAGTADAVVSIAGQNWLIDYKTTNYVGDTAALQVSALAGGEVIIDADGNERPLPSIDRVGVLHINEHGIAMFEVSDSAAKRAAFAGLVVAWHVLHDKSNNRLRPVNDIYRTLA